MAAEKTRDECNHLCEEMMGLLDEGRRVQTDADTMPSMYTTVSEAMVELLNKARQLLSDNINKEDEPYKRLDALVHESEIVQNDLSRRADLWREFVDERDAATEQLEEKRRPLEEIEGKQLRSYEQVSDDLECLKVSLVV